MYILKLYLSYKDPDFMKNVEELTNLLDEKFKGLYDFKVIDLLENPELASEDHIFTTPTLIKKYPPPIKKLIGDLSDIKLLVSELEMTHPSE